MPICILIGISIAGVGVGFAIYHAIKKLNAAPAVADAVLSETSAEAAAALVVTLENSAEEIL